MNPQSYSEAAVDSVESLVTEAVDEYLEAAHRGERPAIESFVARYPSVADVLRKVLPALGVVQKGAVTSSGRRIPEMDGCLGDYRILREIGRGGMGIVYEAEQISLQRRVALKVLPFAAALDPKRLERFKSEAQAAARLHHSNIVPVYAVGCERGVYYYAMQMIEGENLGEVIHQLRQLHGPGSSGGSRASDSRLGDGAAAGPQDAPTEILSRAQQERPAADPDAPTAERRRPLAAADTTTRAQAAISTVQSAGTVAFFQKVADLGIQAAEALEHAHSQDVVHRDIKPANLLVDARGNLWVTDFGLARLLSDAGVTITGDIVGTLRYMSPEQANGRPGVVDHRTDIYSLGATLYELLTLEPVFGGTSREELLRQITNDDPVPARRRRRAIPTDLETILLKAMAKDPQARYASAREMADDLRRFLDCRPIRAKRPSLVELTGKWARRHKSVVASGVVVLLLSVLGLAVSNVLIAREQAKTKDAYIEVARRQALTAKALTAEEEQRKLAERNFRQARQLLAFFVEVSTEDLADQPELQELRSRLLQTSLAYYQDFIEQSGNDPPLQAELAKSHLQVARILHEIGSTPAAESALEQALRTQEALLRDHPHDSKLRDGLFEMYFHLGVMRGRLQLHLISHDSVQRHLRLSPEQVQAIEQIVETQQQQYKEFRNSRTVDLSAMRKQFRQQTNAAQRAIVAVLDEAQNERLQQLVLQRRDTRAFNDPVIARTLQLTAEQQQQIRAIQREASHCDRRIFEVLTPAQQAQWKQLTGEPFPWWRHRPRCSTRRS